MIIIGAGMAGCLAGVVNPNAVIYEAQSALPLDHLAVLRFREDKVSKATGIPFRKVWVQKAIWYREREVQPSPRFSHMYSQKVAGRIMPRSITNIDPVTRFVAPPNFHEMLAELCKSRITYQAPLEYVDAHELQIGATSLPRSGAPVISTIPMNLLAERVPGGHLVVGDVDFSFQPVYVNRYRLEGCDSHCTVYYPDPELGIYRATLTGADLIIESMSQIEEDEIEQVLMSMSLPHHWRIVTEDHQQSYGKIAPIPEGARRAFISGTTLGHSVYSLGRFATWRNILLDDVLDDIYVIRRLIEADTYTHLQER